jgi:outer membrane protein
MNICFRSSLLSTCLPGSTPKLINSCAALIAGLALLAAAPLSHAQRDSLVDIYALAQSNDHQLKSDYAEYLADQEVAAINRSVLRPQITGTASISRTNTDNSGTTSSETDTDNKAYGIALTQQLLNNNAWDTYEQGKTQSRLAKATYAVSEQELIIRSAQAYFDALRATDQLQTDTAEEKAQATLLEQTKQRYEVGLISINDVHETQAAYDSATADRINSEAKVGIQLDALTVITGKLHDDIAPLKEDFVAMVPEPKNKQAWVDFALANNLSLKVSALRVEASQLGKKAAKSHHLPTLTGSINYSDSNNDIDTIGSASRDSDSATTTFSLNFSMPLYTGGGLSARERQAVQTSIRDQEDLLFTRRSTIQNSRSLYLSVTTDIAQLKARKQAIVSNESALSATKAGYDAGTRDIVDVVNAQSNLFQAQRDHLDTLYDYIINTLLLKQAAGILQVSDIELLNSSLKNQ